MAKFVKVNPKNNYHLHIVIDTGEEFDFDVEAELQRISAYKNLYDKNFFNQVNFKNERIYWDYNHDFHIDQVLARAKKIEKPRA